MKRIDIYVLGRQIGTVATWDYENINLHPICCINLYKFVPISKEVEFYLPASEYAKIVFSRGSLVLQSYYFAEGDVDLNYPIPILTNDFFKWLTN
jgi:hypothetical protein